MIVSFSRRFLFVAVPKTAGHAVRARLREQMGPRDWEQCRLFETRAFPVADLAAVGHGHLTCEEVQPWLLPGLWDGLFKFAFVREPVDRFVSAAWFHLGATDRMRTDPLGTMKAVLSDPVMRGHFLFRPQVPFLCDAEGQLMVDMVGRYERLQEDFDAVCGRIGAEPAPLPAVNVTDRPRDATAMDAELTGLIRETYAGDFALFDYTLPSG